MKRIVLGEGYLSTNLDKNQIWLNPEWMGEEKPWDFGPIKLKVPAHHDRVRRSKVRLVVEVIEWYRGPC